MDSVARCRATPPDLACLPATRIYTEAPFAPASARDPSVLGPAPVVSLRHCRGITSRVTSLWLSDRVEQPWAASEIEHGAQRAEVIVVGAGITGLMTAVLLARAGKDVLVLEARTVGACATGNTTAKVSLLQGSHLSKILSKHGKAWLALTSTAIVKVRVGC